MYWALYPWQIIIEYCCVPSVTFRRQGWHVGRISTQHGTFSFFFQYPSFYEVVRMYESIRERMTEDKRGDAPDGLTHTSTGSRTWLGKHGGYYLFYFNISPYFKLTLEIPQFYEFKLGKNCLQIFLFIALLMYTWINQLTAQQL